LERLQLNEFLFNNRKLTIATAAVIVVLIILNLLATRQIIYLNNSGETALFMLTAVFGYGIGSLILLGFTKHITKDLLKRSLLLRILHIMVTIIQFSLLGILLFILYNNITNCPGYFTVCGGNEYFVIAFNAMASLTTAAIMGIISFKFFTWYKIHKRNFVVLFYGLAATALAMSIAGDAFDKLVLVQLVKEDSPSGAIPMASFIYKVFDEYDGAIMYKTVNPDYTTLYLVPNSNLALYNQIIYLTSLSPYILTWIGTAFLLGYYRKKTHKLDFKFWIILAAPLVLYLIGSGLIFSLPADFPFKYYFRLIFRAGTIASSLLFGLAFYLITRNLKYLKVKDYLTIAAIGISAIGIANEISALQQTYGVAAHSVVLLSSYLFSIGLYSSAISLSQDNALRDTVRKSMLELVQDIGTAQMEKDIEDARSIVMNKVYERETQMRNDTGISPSAHEDELKKYMDEIIREINIK
jgi:hypothetical protein